MREYECRGAQATAEMQRAARAVARENARLHALLAQRGVGAREVEAFLARPEEGAGCGDKHGAAPGSQSEGPGASLVAPVYHGLGHGCRLDGSSVTQGDNVTTTYPLESEASEVCPPDRTGARAADGGAPNHIETQVTHCSAAATMIAELQGHGDATQARELLGCGSSRNCHVKNTRLFQLMVETT